MPARLVQITYKSPYILHGGALMVNVTHHFKEKSDIKKKTPPTAPLPSWLAGIPKKKSPVRVNVTTEVSCRARSRLPRRASGRREKRAVDPWIQMLLLSRLLVWFVIQTLLRAGRFLALKRLLENTQRRKNTRYTNQLVTVNLIHNNFVTTHTLTGGQKTLNIYL